MKPKQFSACTLVGLALLWPLFAGTLWAAQANNPRNELRGVQVSADGATTRVVVALARAPQWKLFTLDRPSRAVIDLRGTRGRGFVAPHPDGLVTAVRSGPQANGNLRLVIDLSARARVHAVLLPASARDGPRLLVTIAPFSARFQAPASAPQAAAVSAAAAGAASVATTSSATPSAQAEAAGTGSSRLTAATAPAIRVRAAHAPGNTGRPIIIAVDAGHGGPDPGASGPGGAREKNVVLGIARALAARINRQPGMQAVLTRDGDYFLTLRQRIGKARAAKADMFVSVHADSVRNGDVSGASVYVLSEKGATNEQARWLAERENAADLKGGVSLDDKDATLATVLLNLSQTASLSASLQAADLVLGALDGVGQVRKPQVQQAGFVVLKSPDIPSMLVETAYISNPQDERRLRDPAHQELLAQAIFSGVHRYFEKNPPDGTRYARDRNPADGETVARSLP